MSESFASPDAVMNHALELATLGLGAVEPNPPVGAVLVDDALRVLGSGHHQQFGGPHAEIHALEAAGEAARGAVLYVTLEPCCHVGKTPACTERIIAAGVKRVVVATVDPSPHADGRGVARLRQAGIDVECGLRSGEAERLIAPFKKLVTTGRPFVHVKWAMSWDGRIATRIGDSQWISDDQSRRMVHQLRGHMDAILVGIGTALADDPLLTARPPGPRTATRVVLDSRAQLGVGSRLVGTAQEAPVLIVAGPSAQQDRIEALQQRGVEVLVLADELEGRPDLSAVMDQLGGRQMTNVLIEGGAAVLGSAFDQSLADRAHVFISPIVIGGDAALPAVGGLGCETLDMAVNIVDLEVQQLDRDLYVCGRVSHGSANR